MSAASNVCSVCEALSAAAGFTRADCIAGTVNQCESEGWSAALRDCSAAFDDASQCADICPNAEAVDAGLAMSISDAGATPSDSGSAAESNPGARCGYDSACVPAALSTLCTDEPGTTQYQCCKPAEPASSAGCVASAFGNNDDVATYCCTGTP